ncbi:hypothetical protein CLAVI_000311 [Candidatus Clavichlamydia salmonicola]|uniref:hypothetical protein n=1 Tax=Candidatus Clavichlamydia salmonicola TaxID=469812 RepID=UPI0018915A03|nr:hypothetical protein [Candidatus Clavichlamydia salmonicola]MBF5050696.1 hypothetical protein [Candidatus Clavichlamydia salmonicola]
MAILPLTKMPATAQRKVLQEPLLTVNSPIIVFMRQLLEPYFRRHCHILHTYTGSTYIPYQYLWLRVQLSADHSTRLQVYESSPYGLGMYPMMFQSLKDMQLLLNTMSDVINSPVLVEEYTLSAIQLIQLLASFFYFLQDNLSYKYLLLDMLPNVGELEIMRRKEQAIIRCHMLPLIKSILIELRMEYKKRGGGLGVTPNTLLALSCSALIKPNALPTEIPLRKAYLEKLVRYYPEIISQVCADFKVMLIPHCGREEPALSLRDSQERNICSELNLFPLGSLLPNYKSLLQHLVVEKIFAQCMSGDEQPCEEDASDLHPSNNQ